MHANNCYSNKIMKREQVRSGRLYYNKSRKQVEQVRGNASGASVHLDSSITYSFNLGVRQKVSNSGVLLKKGVSIDTPLASVASIVELFMVTPIMIP